MKTKIIQNIKSIILALILVAGVSYVSATSVWTPPTATPPGNNTDTPINAGTTAQYKNAPLTIGGTTVPTASYKLNVPGLASFNGIVTQTLNIPGGAMGKVLGYNTNGNVAWVDAATPGTTPGGSTFTQTFFLDTAGPYTGDAVAYCPTTHPNVIFCSTAPGNSPYASQSFSSLGIPSDNKDVVCDSNGPCNQTGIETAANLQYMELVSNGSTTGCLFTDYANAYFPYITELICSN